MIVNSVGHAKSGNQAAAAAVAGWLGGRGAGGRLSACCDSSIACHAQQPHPEECCAQGLGRGRGAVRLRGWGGPSRPLLHVDCLRCSGDRLQAPGDEGTPKSKGGEQGCLQGPLIKLID